MQVAFEQSNHDILHFNFVKLLHQLERLNLHDKRRAHHPPRWAFDLKTKLIAGEISIANKVPFADCEMFVNSELICTSNLILLFIFLYLSSSCSVYKVATVNESGCFWAAHVDPSKYYPIWNWNIERGRRMRVSRHRQNNDLHQLMNEWKTYGSKLKGVEAPLENCGTICWIVTVIHLSIYSRFGLCCGCYCEVVDSETGSREYRSLSVFFFLQCRVVS